MSDRSSDEEERGPGFAQYVGSDEEDIGTEERESEMTGASDEESESQDEPMGKRREADLKKSLASVPFGSLLKAQGSLAKANRHREESDESQEEVSEEDLNTTKQRQNGDGSNLAGQKRKAAELERRSDKHAPTELSSRRPVSRKREVVDVQKIQRRDPRFSSLTGTALSKDAFSKTYGFVGEMQVQELKALRQTLAGLKAQERNQAASSSAASKISAERERVERALHRAESKVAERERRERETRVEKEQKQRNKERVKAGLKPFYFKQSEKKAQVLKDKYEQLSGAKKAEADSGAGASAGPSIGNKHKLRKALERRRKKNAAKERKDLPFTDGRNKGGSVSIGSSVPTRLRGNT